MGTVGKYEYTNKAKLAVNQLCDDASTLATQHFPETTLPYQYDLQLSDLIYSMNDAQVLALVSKGLRELECRVLGEHIAKANAAYKRKRIEELKQFI